MLKDSLSNLLKYRQSCCVELLLQGEVVFYRSILLKEEKGSIQIINQLEKTTDFNQVFSNIPPFTPLILLFNGYGILHRQLENLHLSDRDIVNAILPNASAADFLIQETESNNQTFVSIIRKKIIEEHLTKFKEAKLWPVALGIGNFQIQQIIPLLDKTSSIHTETLSIHLTLDGIASFEKNQSEHNESVYIGEDQLSGFLAPAYATALSLLLDTQTDFPIVSDIKEEHLQANIFNKAKYLAAAVLFGILIINTGFYYHFKDKKSALQGQIFTYQDQFDELDKLREDLNKQKAFLTNTRLNGVSKASFYADRIGSSVPKGISLNKLQVFPEKKSTKRPSAKKELKAYQFDKIIVKGTANNSIHYNDWMNMLRQLDWVKEVRNLNYQEDNRQFGRFEMEVIIEL